MRTTLLFSLLSLSALSAPTQYSIDSFTVAGGGTSTGGMHSVNGTIGQHDAVGPMTNGQYSVIGGFWALPVAVQSANSPWLAIVRAAPGLATLSWAPATPGFILQECLSLSPVSWSNSPSGATNPIVIPATLPQKFYRVVKP